MASPSLRLFYDESDHARGLGAFELREVVRERVGLPGHQGDGLGVGEGLRRAPPVQS